MRRNADREAVLDLRQHFRRIRWARGHFRTRIRPRVRLYPLRRSLCGRIAPILMGRLLLLFDLRSDGLEFLARRAFGVFLQGCLADALSGFHVALFEIDFHQLL